MSSSFLTPFIFLNLPSMTSLHKSRSQRNWYSYSWWFLISLSLFLQFHLLFPIFLSLIQMLTTDIIPSNAHNTFRIPHSGHLSPSGLPWCLRCKESSCNAGDPGSIPGLERSPGEGNCSPLQYFCLENSMARGAWQATVYWVTKKQTPTEWLTL